jgi:folate-dependent phosphoribosylglycinamide formyltransferase PurN
MNIAIVISDVTFVKENYNLFLESLFTESTGFQFHLVVLRNNHISLIFKGLGLILIGAHQTGLNLIKNSISAKLFKDHQKAAAKYAVNTSYFDSVNTPSFLEFIKKHEIELIINARTRNIYKKKILETPKWGCLNIHHGLLPDYRGTMCDLYALFADRPAGFSIHKMQKKIDSGAIVKTKIVTNQNSKAPLNFPLHIYNSSKVEGSVVANLLQTIKETQSIPIENENITQAPIYTLNPDFKLIRQMLHKGMIL